MHRLHGLIESDGVKAKLAFQIKLGLCKKLVRLSNQLGRGVQRDVYASLSNALNMLSRTGAVENAISTSIPANAGVTVDGQMG